MDAALKSSKPDSSANRRTRISIPILIRGKDISGQPFEQGSRTIVVTNRGLLVEAIQQLWLGAEVQIENPALGSKRVGRVVWWPSESPLMRANEVGIYMPDAEDFCGIALGTNGDGHDPAIVQSQTEQGSPASATEAASLNTPAASDASPAAPGPSDAAAAPAAVSAEPAAVVALETTLTGAETESTPSLDVSPVEEKLPQASPVVDSVEPLSDSQEPATILPSSTDEIKNQRASSNESVLDPMEQSATSLEDRLQSSRAEAESMLAKLDDLRERTQSRLLASAATLERTMLASLEQQVVPIGERIEKSRVEVEAMLADLAQIETRAQANLEESASRAEQRLVEAVEQQLGSVGNHLQSSRAQIDTLLLKLDELQKAGEAEVARVRNALPEAGGQAMQFALEDMTQRIRSEMESAGSRVVDETRERVHREGAAAIQAFIESGELEANLERVLQSQGTIIFGQFQKDSDHLSQQTLAAMQQKSDEIIRSASSALSDQAASAQGNLQALIARSSAELQRAAQQAMESASQQFAERQTVLLNDAAENLRHTVDGLIDSAGSRMRELAETNLQLIDQQLAGKQKAFVDETVKAFREKLGEILRLSD